MASAWQARIIFHALSGLARDDAVITLNGSNGTDLGPSGDVATAMETFWGANNVHQHLSGYLSPDRLTTHGVTLEVYDITGHLDGSDHGSPFWGDVFDLPDNTAHGPLPDLAAACLSFHADLTGIVESGAVGPIPTPEAAQDMGAPATHEGQTRPRARKRGRVFFGPLNDLCLDWTGPGNRPVLHANFLDDATFAMHRLANAGVGWAVWSRRDGAMHNVQGGWVDNRFTAQRKREEDASLRVLWSA